MQGMFTPRQKTDDSAELRFDCDGDIVDINNGKIDCDGDIMNLYENNRL